ncbi:hypothetical protein BH18ACT17_BH18ACT17_13150 [soil metagenome]
MRKKKLAALAVIAAVLVACAEHPSVPLADSGTPSPDPAAEILERLGSSRVQTLSSAENVVQVEGSASDDEADLTRTLWYEAIAAAAYAQLVPVRVASRTVMGDAGTILALEEDPVAVGSQDAVAPSGDTEEDIGTVLESGAKSVGVDVVGIAYVDLFGGVAEVVIEPGDAKRFVSEAGSNVPILLDRLATQQHPYLVTVVDADQHPLLVIGYTPGLGGDGQGLAWDAPAIETDAIWGVPVTPEQFEGGDA